MAPLAEAALEPARHVLRETTNIHRHQIVKNKNTKAMTQYFYGIQMSCHYCAEADDDDGDDDEELGLHVLQMLAKNAPSSGTCMVVWPLVVWPWNLHGHGTCMVVELAW